MVLPFRLNLNESNKIIEDNASNLIIDKKKLNPRHNTVTRNMTYPKGFETKLSLE